MSAKTLAALEAAALAWADAQHAHMKLVYQWNRGDPPLERNPALELAHALTSAASKHASATRKARTRSARP